MNREWMYRRFTSDGYISPEFHQGLESFIQFACGQPRFMDGDKIRCPCRKCKNLAFRDLDTVRLHVCSKGFVFNYHVWSVQGERRNVVQRPNVVGSTTAAGPSQYRQMIIDVAAASMFNMDSHINVDEAIDDVEEPPNPEAQKFYDMLRAADTELWPGCRNHSQLSLVARMINLKSENNISEKCFDQFAELMKEIVPDNNEDCKKKSETAKKNRLAEPDGPGTGVVRHRGGSKSAVAYSYEMARDKGISIRDTVYPTFQKLHYSEAEKSYTTAKAKRIAEEVECGLEDLNQSLPDGVSPTPADTTEIFIGAAQNPKKNRVFGVGTLYSPPSVSSRWEAGGSGFPSMGIDDERYQKLQAEYEAEKERRQALERRQGGLEQSHQQLLDEFKQTKLLLERLLRRDTQTDE